MLEWSPPSRARQLVALLLVLPFGLVVLAVLNLSLSYAIWGELVVAWIILAFAILGATHVARVPLERWLHVGPLPLWQALSWALVVVVGLPLSYTFKPLGLAVLIGPAVAFWIVQLVADRRGARERHVLVSDYGVGRLAS